LVHFHGNAFYNGSFSIFFNKVFSSKNHLGGIYFGNNWYKSTVTNLSLN
jgi:hypothetical protein